MSKPNPVFKFVIFCIAAIIALAGFYYMGLNIIGFITASEEASYVQSINLIVNESSEYIWELNSSAPLRSIRIS